jgi:hypothetical protein
MSQKASNDDLIVNVAAFIYRFVVSKRVYTRTGGRIIARRSRT